MRHIGIADCFLRSLGPCGERWRLLLQRVMRLTPHNAWPQVLDSNDRTLVRRRVWPCTANLVCSCVCTHIMYVKTLACSQNVAVSAPVSLTPPHLVLVRAVMLWLSWHAAAAVTAAISLRLCNGYGCSGLSCLPGRRPQRQINGEQPVFCDVFHRIAETCVQIGMTMTQMT